MTRSLTKWGLAAILTGGVWAASAAPAAAQFMPGFRPGFYWMNPMTGQQFNYNYNYNTSWHFNWVNPYTGGRYMYNYQTNWAGFPPPYAFAPYGYNYGPSYANPYMAGGVGLYGSSNSADNPFVREQLRVFRNAPVPNQGPAGEPKPGEPQPSPDLRNRPAGLVLTGLNKALVEPTDEAILTGKVLNELATTIRGLESKGAKAEAPLLPAELVSHIHYEGGPSANVITLLRTGKPAFPTALQAAQHDALRADLDRAITPVLEPIAAGKRPEAGAADRLATTVKKAKESLAETTKGLPEGEARELRQYFITLESLARVGRDASTAGLFPQRWTSVGATVSELVRHMDKYKLIFGRAAAGDEDVYYSLHRGLVGYYAALAHAKK